MLAMEMCDFDLAGVKNRPKRLDTWKELFAVHFACDEYLSKLQI